MTDDAAVPVVDAELLHQFLRGRDVACPSCGYNLRDLPGDRCPECGQVIALRLQMAEPKLAAMLTGLIGISAGAGLNGLLLIYFMMMVFVVRRRAPGMGYFLAFNLVGFAVEGTALAAWLLLWRRIRRLPPVARWVLAAVGCALSLLDILAFSLTLR